MEFDNKLFEGILTEAKVKSDILGVDGYDDSVYKDLMSKEDDIMKNKDLYDIYFSLNKILETKKVYHQIQSIAPAINVNTGSINIAGVTKEKDPASLEAIEDFKKQVKSSIPKGMKFKFDLDENTQGKYKFNILISRK